MEYFNERLSTTRLEKQIIAKYVVSKLLQGSDEVVLGGGTTVWYIGKAITSAKHIKNMRIFTCNLALICDWLKSSPQVFEENTVAVLGGLVVGNRKSIASKTFRNLNKIERGIIGCSAINSKKGPTVIETDSSVQSLGIIEACKEVIIAADHTKLQGAQMPVTIRQGKTIQADIDKGKKYILVTTKPKTGKKEFESRVEEFKSLGIEVKVLNR